MKRLLILGAGGYGRTVADLARQSGQFELVAFLDDGNSAEDVVGWCEDYVNQDDGQTAFLPAFGNNSLRLGWVDRLAHAKCPVATIVHASAYVSPEATLGAGTVVLPHAVVNTACAVGRGCIINCGAIVDHGCVVEDGAHVCLGAIVKGENRIAAMSKIEAGTVIERGTYPV